MQNNTATVSKRLSPDEPTGAETTAQTRSIPSLDGLRALAISLVILAHCAQDYVTNPKLGGFIFELGQTGVSLFFIISGFLITFLLDKERAQTGTIDLKAFYIRRTFRIFPPFYVYLALVLVLWAFGVPEHLGSVIASATYTWNYYLKSHGALLASTSTLSLEEQFYLFWPFCLKVMRIGRARVFALWVIALMPFSRALTYHFFPAAHESGKVSGMFHTRLDTLMFGCLLALVWRSERFKEMMRRASPAWSFHASWVLGLIVLPLGLSFLGPAYHFCYLTLSGAALTWALIYVVRKPHTSAGRLLNLAPVRYVGVLSYSLYLYQQMFAGPLMRMFPLNLVFAFAAAMASYYLVERPSLRLRDRFMHRGAAVAAG